MRFITSCRARRCLVRLRCVNADIVTALKAGIKEVLGVDAKAYGIGGGTVAAFFRRLNLPVVVGRPRGYTIVRRGSQGSRWRGLVSPVAPWPPARPPRP